MKKLFYILSLTLVLFSCKDKEEEVSFLFRIEHTNNFQNEIQVFTNVYGPSRVKFAKIIVHVDNIMNDLKDTSYTIRENFETRSHFDFFINNLDPGVNYNIQLECHVGDKKIFSNFIQATTQNLP